MTANKLIKILKTLKYFDSNLAINKDKVEAISATNTNSAKRFTREAIIVNKYIAAHYFKLLNDKTLISPEVFKWLILNGKKKGETSIFIQKLQKTFYSMDEQEFNNYKIAHDTLNS